MTKRRLIAGALLLGSLAFAAGTLAPGSLRVAVSTAKSALTNQIAEPAPKEPTAPDPKPTAQASDPAPKDDETPPVPYKHLLIGQQDPGKTQYALEIGLFPDKQSIEPWESKLKAFGYPSKVIPIVDSSGARRLLLAAGKYSSRDAARSARVRVSRALEMTQPPMPIRLPGKSKTGG